jgi:leucyl aminopeptidase
MFLYQFAKDHGSETKWAHIDTASRMTAAPGDYLEKGSAGAPVRLLVTLLRNYYAQ